MGPAAGGSPAADTTGAGGAAAATAAADPSPYPTELAKPDRSRFALAIVSLALGIPLTAIASTTSGTFGLVLSWVGIIAVNAVYAFGGRGRT